MINETQILMQLVKINEKIGSHNTCSDGWVEPRTLLEQRGGKPQKKSE